MSLKNRPEGGPRRPNTSPNLYLYLSKSWDTLLLRERVKQKGKGEVLEAGGELRSHLSEIK